MDNGADIREINRRVIDQFRAGGPVEGMQRDKLVLLTTTGRRSGQARTTPLIYGRDGERYVIVASRGGAPAHPAWYENLSARPEVHLQVMADRFKARARTAGAAERATLWKTMAAIWPPYDEYQAKTSRQIPVVVLERV